MNYQNRILCYFDILGFGDKVKTKIKEAKEINQLFEEIALIIDYYRSDDNDIQISHFSDSFVVSILKTQNSPTQLEFIISILTKLLEYQLIARGAIGYGELIHNSKHIFGPVLVKLVKMEEMDKYPRIVIDDSLLNLTMPTIGGFPISFINFFNDFVYVKTDSLDNKKYIDFIGEINKKESTEKNELIKTLKKIIVENIEVTSLSAKYEWLKLKLEELDLNNSNEL